MAGSCCLQGVGPLRTSWGWKRLRLQEDNEDFLVHLGNKPNGTEALAPSLHMARLGGDRDPRGGFAANTRFHATQRLPHPITGQRLKEETELEDAQCPEHKASKAGSSGSEGNLGVPYRGIDGEGPLSVACSDVEGEECVAPAVSVTGQDVGDEAGDGAILTDGDVHGQVQQHWVIVIDV